MRFLDWLDKMLPGSAIQTTAERTKGIRKQYVDEYMKRDRLVYKLTTAADTGIISKEQARRELGIDDPYEGWATRSEHQWRERAEAMQAQYMDPNIKGEPWEGLAVPLSGKYEVKGKCLWCTTPYEDDSGSCTKCGAPKDIEKVGEVALMMTST